MKKKSFSNKVNRKPGKRKNPNGGRPATFEGVDTRRLTIKIPWETHKQLLRTLADSGFSTQNEYINQAIIEFAEKIKKRMN